MSEERTRVPKTTCTKAPSPAISLRNIESLLSVLGAPHEPPNSSKMSALPCSELGLNSELNSSCSLLRHVVFKFRSVFESRKRNDLLEDVCHPAAEIAWMIDGSTLHKKGCDSPLKWTRCLSNCVSVVEALRVFEEFKWCISLQTRYT